jgi:hypothetical protein
VRPCVSRDGRQASSLPSAALMMFFFFYVASATAAGVMCVLVFRVVEVEVVCK